MTASGNTLDEFPAAASTILVFCETCERTTPLDRSKVPNGSEGCTDYPTLDPTG